MQLDKEKFKSFNSILVRLKENGEYRAVMPSSKFQFHTGSIKRKFDENKTDAIVKKFQFHTGSIKSLLRLRSKAS